MAQFVGFDQSRIGEHQNVRKREAKFLTPSEKGLVRMAIAHGRDDNVLSLRYKLLLGAAYTAFGTLVIAVGVWGGLRFTSRLQTDTLFPHSVGEEAQSLDSGVEDGVAYDRPKSEYAPLVSVKTDNDVFTVMVDRTGTIRAGVAISGTGFREVYDQKGRLVRRYAAVEDTDSTWELMEFMRLPSSP
jgi:hypothetical protein